MTLQALDTFANNGSRSTSPLAAMRIALTLVESASTEALRQRAAQVLGNGLGLDCAECLYVEGSGRWLGRDDDAAQFDCSDFSHP